MPTSTQDVAVNSLAFHTGTYANHYVIAYRSGTDDSGRILASTLFNDNPLTAVSVNAPITGNGFGVPLELQLNTNAINVDTYFADDSVTAVKLSGTFPRAKFNLTVDTNGNYVTIGSATAFTSVSDPITGTGTIGAGETPIVADTISSNKDLELKGFVAGTSCSITSSATEITINSTDPGANFGVGTANNVVTGVYELDLDTGNVFDITVGSETLLYIRFINFVSRLRGHLVTLRITTSTAVDITFENADFGDNAEFKTSISSNNAYVGFIDDVEDYVIMLSQNRSL